MNLFCEHYQPFLQTFPKKGMTQDGRLYELAMREPLTVVSDFSSLLLPTPTASLNEPAPWKPGVEWWRQSRATRNLEGVVTGNTPLLATPNARDGKGSPTWKEQKSLPKDISLLPTPSMRDTKGASDAPGRHYGSGIQLPNAILDLLPTPDTGTTPNGHGHRGGRPDNGHQSGAGLDGVVKDLLPTPKAADGGWSPAGGKGKRGSSAGQGLRDTSREVAVDWGKYAPAVERWEAILRPAPLPTEPGKNGKPRLSPELPEWMMGLPDGWVTDAPGLNRQDQLKAVGNGVCPQQAILALRILLE